MMQILEDLSKRDFVRHFKVPILVPYWHVPSFHQCVMTTDHRPLEGWLL